LATRRRSLLAYSMCDIHVSMKEFELLIDSHTHWGPSMSMGTEVTTQELLAQKEESGMDYVVIIPFPSTAIAGNHVNLLLLEESTRVAAFIPYHYIREDFEKEDFNPIPEAYYGGKWHWMRGWQDSASNYEVLSHRALPALLECLQETGKPVICEEELSFTERLVEMAPGLPLIIPHLGMLGGNPHDFLRSFKNNQSIYFDTALSTGNNILRFVETIGPHRVLFGSDVPFGRMRIELEKVRSLPLPHADKALILSGNFLRLTKFQRVKGADSAPLL
jgi:uncharacterized protein